MTLTKYRSQGHCLGAFTKVAETFAFVFVVVVILSLLAFKARKVMDFIMLLSSLYRYKDV